MTAFRHFRAGRIRARSAWGSNPSRPILFEPPTDIPPPTLRAVKPPSPPVTVVPLAESGGRGYNSSVMKKSKPAAPKQKKSPKTPADPEWEHLEERFNSLNDEFGKLAELMEDEKK